MAIATIALTGCEKFLEENPSDRLSTEDAFSTHNQLFLNAVASLYRGVGGSSNTVGLQGTGHGVYDLNTFSTDEAIMPTRGADWYDGGYWQALYLHQFEKADGTGDVWNYLMKEILNCNASLEHIHTYASAHKDDNVSAWEMEVRALRAMYYFYAMDLYGRLPIFDSSTPTVSELALKPRSQVFNFIVNELLETRSQLPTNHSNEPGEYYGRFTQGPADFLLAKLLLNVEVYADDDWADNHRPSGSDINWNIGNKQLNSWEAVVYFCDELFALGYDLEPLFESNFIINNEKSSENIFTIPMNKYLYDNQFINLFRSRHYNHAAALGLNGENGSSATLEALQIFGYTPQGVSADTDPRFPLTYYFEAVDDWNGNPITLDDGTPLVYEPWAIALDVSGEPCEKTAGARMSKYEVDPHGIKDGKQSDNDIVLFRYADALLMKAEALVRNGQDGSEPFNMVRDRVIASSIPCTLSNILDERLRELAWEGWRRNDLIRFDRFTRSYSFRPSLPGEQETHYTIVFPIPGEFLTLTGSTQNSGY
ncbi:MAG: RagB/SusD family nutrient uptake outer membrane protein [Muribaculaceae bacterium]|nr:RagB/SusD family nutrient uptake outer membrane protein [Muribaculaceae bacterium]